MYRLRAAQRLASVGDPDMVEAQLNSDKIAELYQIQARLKEARLIFSFVQPHPVLFHKSNAVDIRRESEDAYELLQHLGYGLRAYSGIFGRPTFALKGKDGIVLQKVQNGLRIFFTQ
jgi:LytS/YehU family sensor histidine kinase